MEVNPVRKGRDLSPTLTIRSKYFFFISTINGGAFYGVKHQ
jgi:hypothetical protein